MDSWRKHIVDRFTSSDALLTLAADPDGLLLDELIVEALQEHRFEIVPFESSISFRYLYESRFRPEWERGADKPLIVAVNAPTKDLALLPFDLLQVGRKVSISLAKLFPKLSYPVVSLLPKEHLGILFQATQGLELQRLGEDATKDFILRHVFRIAPEFVKEAPDVLHVLLRHHYGSRRIPTPFLPRLIDLLHGNPAFKLWPLEQLLSDTESFTLFLQERWKPFLDSLVHELGTVARESGRPVQFAVEGPTLLPFDHDEVRIYIDSLFFDNILKPIPYDRADKLGASWAQVGVLLDEEAHLRRRLAGLLDALESSMPSPRSRHGDWTQFAYRWAEFIALWLSSDAENFGSIASGKNILENQIDERFAEWLVRRYAGLMTLAPVPPVLVNHIPRHLARVLEQDENTKAALIVIDGLALDQWIVVRNTLNMKLPQLAFQEQAVFARVPTVTPVSRQAIFAGEHPFHFRESIGSVHREELLWKSFWQKQGLQANETFFAKTFGIGGVTNIFTTFDWSRIRAAGFIITAIDESMHGVKLGGKGRHAPVKQWANGDFLADLITMLHDKGFRLFVAADHGNVEAVGIGNPSDGVLAESRGARARIFRSETLRRKVQDQFGDALVWSSGGLPDDYFPLLAPGRTAFTTKGSKIVTHGGITLEEVVVPLVEIGRRDG